jgi:hypothetical protein
MNRPGSAASYSSLAVVQHDNDAFSLHLSEAQMNDLVEYLKSL